MRKLLALTIVTSLLTGCLTTDYVMRNAEGRDVRFGPPRDDERTVRHIVREERQHYFLLGTIPYDPRVDVAKLARLRPGQSLANTRIETSMNGWDVALTLGIGYVTLGLSLLVWTPRTTTLSGDIVEPKVDGDQDEDGDEPEAAPEPDEEAEEPADDAGSFFVLDGPFTQKEALAACHREGAQLARKADLAAARKAGRLDRRAGDVWTGDDNGRDGWTFNTSSGAPFLQDPGEKLSAICLKKGN